MTLESLGALIARDPATAQRSARGRRARCPQTDRLAQLTRAAWNQGVVLTCRPGSSSPSPIVPALGRRRRGPRPDHADDRRARRRAPRPRSSRSSCRPPRRPPGRQSLLTGTHRGHPRRGRQARDGQRPGLGPDTVAFQHRVAPHRDRAPRSTGRSPSSAAGWSAAASTTGSRATAVVGRAGRDRLRRRRAALRPDVATRPTSAATRPATCCRRARSSTARGPTSRA